jgi:hypothetical protein
MDRALSLTSRTLLGCIALLTACADPFHPNLSSQAPQPNTPCPASADWLPQTPALQMFMPLAHPGGDCPFYRGAWQSFLFALQPDAKGVPALASYPTIDTVFTPSAPLPASRSFLGDIKQAGGRQILIDQNGNSLYYGIHVNQAYADFIAANGLQTAAALRAYPNDPVKSQLTFPAGVVEFKSAWQIVEGNTAAQAANFVSLTTTVPTLSQDPVTHVIVEDRNNPRTVTVRLLALHVVFTLPGHPEFVWSTFEHSTGMSTGNPDSIATDGQRDVAPVAGDNPVDTDPSNHNNTRTVDTSDYILYKANTPANLGNIARNEATDLALDPATQKFHLTDGSLAQTSVYRLFPGSKSDTTDQDDDITSLNHNVEALFSAKAGALDPTDQRGNYRLVGAQWMDKPMFFKVNVTMQNDATSPLLSDHMERQGSTVVTVPALTLAQLTAGIQANGTEPQSTVSILGGEDRLSSTAMESFTQAADSFPNCLTCHNTEAVTANGIPVNRDKTGTPVQLLGPGGLNVSHVLSEFLLEDMQRDAGPVASDAGTPGADAGSDAGALGDGGLADGG